MAAEEVGIGSIEVRCLHGHDIRDEFGGWGHGLAEEVDYNRSKHPFQSRETFESGLKQVADQFGLVRRLSVMLVTILPRICVWILVSSS